MSVVVPTLPLPPILERRTCCPAGPRRMTRCECSGVAFSEVRDLVRRAGLSLEQACERTGCGSTCTGCLPDLQHFLEA